MTEPATNPLYVPPPEALAALGDIENWAPDVYGELASDDAAMTEEVELLAARLLAQARRSRERHLRRNWPARIGQAIARVLHGEQQQAFE